MDLADQWDRLLLCLRDVMTPTDVNIWLKKAQAVRLVGEDLFIEVPNRFYAEWIRDNFLGEAPVVAALEEVFGKPVQVRFLLHDDPTSEVPRGDPGEPSTGTAAAPTPGAAGAAAPDARPVAGSNRAPAASGRGRRTAPAPSTSLNPSQSFTSFVVGECNRFAHAAAQGVADRPVHRYNPLYIYGDSGLGKTHLMNAIGNAVVGRQPDLRVLYVTAEDFTNQMIESIRRGTTEQFRELYRRNADILLVDDIQFLSGKDRTQEEFFHTFNALQNANKQVVLTSDKEPSAIHKLEPRLRTRFEGGLLADMQPPDHETLLAILKKKAGRTHLELPDDLAEAIARSANTSIRELEGVIHRLSALHSMMGEPLTLEFAQRHLPKVFAPEPTVVSAHTIIDTVARYHNIRSADILGKRRTRALTKPRHIAMYLARTHTNMSFPELGKEFGGRDHSTIQHGVRKVERELKKDNDLAYVVRMLEQSMGLQRR